MMVKLPFSFTLETERLQLKFPTEEEISLVFSATRYPGFHDGMVWDKPEEISELNGSLKRNIVAWEQGVAYIFSILDKQTDEFLGRILLRRNRPPAVWDLGFWTHPESQGKGIMTEALGAVLTMGFTSLEADLIEADYALWNIGSKKVLERNGLRFVEHIPKGFLKKGEWVEENRMAISQEEWQKRNNPGA